MLGFILVGVGFDGACSFVKSYSVACIPASECTSFLFLCVITASGGGLFTSVLGMLDMSFTGLPTGAGMSGVLNVAVAAVTVIVSIIVGLLITLLTGWALRRHTALSAAWDDGTHSKTDHISTSQRNQHRITTEETEIDTCSVDITDTTRDTSQPHNKETKANILTGNNSRFAESNDNNEKLSETHHITMPSHEATTRSNDNTDDDEIMSKSLPISNNAELTGIKRDVQKRRSCSSLHEEERISEAADKDLEQKKKKNREEVAPPGTKRDYGAVKARTVTSSEDKIESREPSPQASVKKETESTTEGVTKASKTCCQGGVKVRIALIVLSAAMAVGMAFIFSVGSSDYVGRAIFRGDPDAAVSTDSLSRQVDYVL
ncbi:uncharacterized protein LOC143296561 [Babylonia areolata]|uniref:uncharacterized protein LOC143296561 n=1 Tax=Babylonia areolata TaxID=304850 RepID=UPI003FCF2E7E